MCTSMAQSKELLMSPLGLTLRLLLTQVAQCEELLMSPLALALTLTLTQVAQCEELLMRIEPLRSSVLQRLL